MKKTLLFFLLSFISVALYAQVTTSSLTGTVLEPNGESAIGTSVKATHVPSGTSYSTVVNETGRFNIPNTRVRGPYIVEMSHVSFQTSTFEKIILLLGQPYIVNATLNEARTPLGDVVMMGQCWSKVNAKIT